MKRNIIIDAPLQANRHEMSIDTNNTMVMKSVFKRPNFSAIDPKITAPNN